MHLGYEDKLKLVALHRQAMHGKYGADSSKAESVGLFDVIGNDRRCVRADRPFCCLLHRYGR